MPNLRDGLSQYREAHKSLLPLNDLVGVRFNKLHGTKIRAQAALLNCSPAELLRMFVQKGAEHYGFDLDSASIF